jgi:hypothetical protein
MCLSDFTRLTVVAFLRWRPELLISKEIPGEGAFPSPRSWEATSNILGLQMSAAIEREMILGAIGEGATIEFDAYLRTARDLPAIQSILEAPTKAPIGHSTEGYKRWRHAHQER